MAQLSLFQGFVARVKTESSLSGAGILAPSDPIEFSGTTQKIYELLKDGKWHTSLEIQAVSFPAMEFMRRLRDLRPHFEIENRRTEVCARLFEYRLVNKLTRL